MKDIITKCVNGNLQVGDIVVSTPKKVYSCLVGVVMRINLVGTAEHDTGTCNETDDVHVNFSEYTYSEKRIKEIEEVFSAEYGMEKTFDNCALDDVIMNPECLIRVTDTEENILEHLLESGYNAACYCYVVLHNLISTKGK